jgi:intergrase/recombinase
MIYSTSMTQETNSFQAADVHDNAKNTLAQHVSVKKYTNDNRKSLTARVKPEDLPIINQRLKLYGFNSINELVHDFIKGKFPQITEDRQIENLINNTQSNGLKSFLEGGSNRDFYEKSDLNDMYNYYLNIRKFHPKTCRDLTSYFKRFREQFFTERVEELRTLSPRIRSKIMDAFRKFGQYYFYKYNNDQCTDLVTKIIRRQCLYVGNTDHGKLYIVDDNYLQNKLKLLLECKGDIGTILKYALFSGLREEELVYVYNKPICQNLSGCICQNLHVLNKPNRTSVILIQWHRGHKKCYFTIVPTKLWEEFRSLPSFAYNPHIKSAHAYIKTKDATLTFMWLRKAHYNVMCRTMKPFEANILAGRAKTVDAKHYAMYELDLMSSNYINTWSKFGINDI